MQESMQQQNEQHSELKQNEYAKHKEHWGVSNKAIQSVQK